MSITILGLGPGSPDQLTLEAWNTLSKARTVILRTARHPTVPHLPEGPAYRSLDGYYDSAESFEVLYERIAQEVIAAGAEADVIYAVPGHPLVAERSVLRIRELAAERGLSVRVIAGLSFVEPALSALGVDATDGLQIHDALLIAAMHHPPLNPDAPALIAQVYDRRIASDLKLTLMNQYPDEHTVALLHAAGTPAEQVEHLALYEIDRSTHIGDLTTLYVPPLAGYGSFEALQEVMAHLRAPEGCPWDRKQTHETLRPYVIEEAYEVVDALDAGDTDKLREELGDLLLQVIFHAQIAVEDGEFFMSDVIRHIIGKMHRRHPHVWGDVDVQGSAEQVVSNWEAIKQAERSGDDHSKSKVLGGVSRSLPALNQAYEYQERAARVGFDWPEIQPVLDKIGEEVAEIEAAGDDSERAKEMGDLLFVLVNWMRWRRVEPETVLRAANARFYRRFHYIEQAAAGAGRELTAMTLAEMDALWDEAKANGL